MGKKQSNKKTEEFNQLTWISSFGAKIRDQRLPPKLCAVLARIPLKMADTEVSSQNSQKSSQFSQSDLPELLNQYYKRLFPYKYFVQWLSYGGGSEFLKSG